MSPLFRCAVTPVNPSRTKAPGAHREDLTLQKIVMCVDSSLSLREDCDVCLLDLHSFSEHGDVDSPFPLREDCDVCLLDLHSFSEDGDVDFSIPSQRRL